MRNAVLITAFLLLLFYITGTFCSADLYMANWDSELRKGLGIGFIFIEILFLFFYGIGSDNRTNK